MASSGERDKISISGDDDVKFGFKRKEMYTVNFACTSTIAIPHGRHLFLCYKSRESWPRLIADSDSNLVKLLYDALAAHRYVIKPRTLFTICEGSHIGLSDGDALLFPDMIKYRNLKDSDVDGFVEDVLLNGNTWGAGIQEVLTGSYVFVCAHKNHDRRCGVCGPVLIEKFKQEIESKGLQDKVFVTACSHIGGHKFAGNVIIFSADSKGKVDGHWYGYVTPNDVPQLLDQHIKKKKIIKRIWRGQMDEYGSFYKKPDRMRKWERSEVLTILAVLGAVATVGLICAFKRLP